METIKLTKAQKEIISRLRNGQVITHNEKNFIVCKTTNDIKVIRWDVWDRLRKADLIDQQLSYPFDYVLTEKGKQIKI
jgi:DUF4097 and DUF4098 domain-containing protein YvlB